MVQKIIDYYISYGMYVCTQRSIASINDGLKPVERRILVSTMGTDKFTKAATVVGLSLRLHPHSPESVYDTLSNLVRNGLIDGQGNWGCNVGLVPEVPSAMRYTECRESQRLKTVKRLMKFVPVVEGESRTGEPLFLPWPYPLCLAGKSIYSCVAFGISAKYPIYKENDLLAVSLGKKSVITPYVEGNVCVDGDFESIMECGRGSLVFEPVVDYHEDEIIIRGLPVEGASLKTVLSSIQEIRDRNISIIDSSKTMTEVVLSKVARKRIDFEEFKKKIRKLLRKRINVNVLAVKDDKIISIGVRDWCSYVYGRFEETYRLYAENALNAEVAKLDEANKILKIRPHVKGVYDRDDAPEIISGKTKIPVGEVSGILTDNSIKRLIYAKLDIDEIGKEAKRKEKELENYKENCSEFSRSFI